MTDGNAVRGRHLPCLRLGTEAIWFSGPSEQQVSLSSVQLATKDSRKLSLVGQDIIPFHLKTLLFVSQLFIFSHSSFILSRIVRQWHRAIICPKWPCLKSKSVAVCTIRNSSSYMKLNRLTFALASSSVCQCLLIWHSFYFLNCAGARQYYFFRNN